MLSLPSGRCLHIETTDPSSSAPKIVIFIHGLGSSTSTYGPTIKSSGIASTHRVIMPDAEGWGLSPLTSGEIDITIERYAEDVKDIMDATGLEKAGIIAHSMGGLVATTFASKYPSMLDFLVLISPAANLSPAVKAALEARAKGARESGISGIVDGLILDGVSEKTRIRVGVL